MVRPEDFLDGHEIASSVYEKVCQELSELGPFETRTSKSQIAFRRRRGFAYLWLPGQYLRGPHADVVLSVALARHVPSPRFKEVVQPSPGRWMHHLELGGPEEIDAEVVEWLREAASHAD